MHIIKIDQGHRIRIPRELAPDWSQEKPITLLPLRWKRAIELPPEKQMEAWLLCDLSTKSEDDWLVSPYRVRELAEEDATASDLASVMFNLNVEKNKGAWRITCPKLVRELGWLPKAGGKIILKSDPVGLSIWTETTFRILFTSLAGQWEE